MTTVAPEPDDAPAEPVVPAEPVAPAEPDPDFPDEAAPGDDEDEDADVDATEPDAAS